MYTLRTIQEDEVIINEEIGDHYTLVRAGTPKFNEWIDLAIKCKDSQKKCVAIIHGPKAYYRPIYSGNGYYVMTDEGKTFERI